MQCSWIQCNVVQFNNNINLTYYNNYSENLNSSSSAYLTEYIIDYSFNDSLASYSINRSLLNAYFSYNGSFKRIWCCKILWDKYLY